MRATQYGRLCALVGLAAMARADCVKSNLYVNKVGRVPWEMKMGIDYPGSEFLVASVQQTTATLEPEQAHPPNCFASDTCTHVKHNFTARYGLYKYGTTDTPWVEYHRDSTAGCGTPGTVPTCDDNGQAGCWQTTCDTTGRPGSTPASTGCGPNTVCPTVPFISADGVDDCKYPPDGRKGCCNALFCHDGDATYYCVCNAGFYGPDCDQTQTVPAVKHCDAMPCGEKAVCTDTTMGYYCTCNAGYAHTDTSKANIEAQLTSSGALKDQQLRVVAGAVGSANFDRASICQKDINECVSSPCQNGGTCTEQVDGYSCACSTGWEGPTCAGNIDACLTNPCENGKCRDVASGSPQFGTFSCDCDFGWRDTKCDHYEIWFVVVVVVVVVLALVLLFVIMCVPARARHGLCLFAHG